MLEGPLIRILSMRISMLMWLWMKFRHWEAGKNRMRFIE